MSYVDDLLEELQIREAAIKESKKRIDEIKNWCKEQGSFNTGRYVCVVLHKTRTGLKGLDDVVAAIGWEVLEKNDLIKVTEFLTIQVSQIETIFKGEANDKREKNV